MDRFIFFFARTYNFLLQTVCAERSERTQRLETDGGGKEITSSAPATKQSQLLPRPSPDATSCVSAFTHLVLAVSRCDFASGWSPLTIFSAPH